MSLNTQARVVGIKHTITPDKWLMDLTFGTTGQVAAPQSTPSVPAAVTAGSGGAPAIASTEFTASSGTLAPGAESGDIVVGHDLGHTGYVIAGHLEDGAWATDIGWRVKSRAADYVVFKFRNLGPNTAAATLRYRLIY